MKQIMRFFTFLNLLLFSVGGYSQPIPGNQKTIDSLVQELHYQDIDTNGVKILVHLAKVYTNSDFPTALEYARKALNLSTKLNYHHGLINSLQALAFVYAVSGKWTAANQVIYQGLSLSKTHSPIQCINFYNLFALVCEKQNNKSQRLKWLRESLHSPYFNVTTPLIQERVYYNLGETFETIDQLDSARYYIQKADKIASKHHISYAQAFIKRVLGRILVKEGHYQQALLLFHQAFNLAKQIDNLFFAVENQLELAETFHKMGLSDSAVYYGKLALHGSKNPVNYVVMATASKVLSEELEAIQPALAMKYLKTMVLAHDSLYNVEKLQQAQNITDIEKQRVYVLQNAKDKYKHRIRQNTLLFILSTSIAVCLVLIYTNRQKKLANVLLNIQRDEIQKQKDWLQSTQAQLIQAEKLASLGELTAGIAHEIQNPLNFVNNFAEVSAEMLVEMDAELDKGDVKEAKAISADLQQNLSKINHHGQRASSIVKGMLEHSRASTGVKEPTDLNALADEYLRLAYHGLRAKDNDFNVTMETHFDPDLPKVSVIPQDIGRVLLNLINNAFYAVQQRAVEHATSLQPTTYQPKVTVSTQKTENQVIIKIQDNGNGIPEAIREKIFQPFFTTKPTGQGTGLGLSLAYDIVTKGHGGALEVNSQVEKSTEFILSIPL